MEINYVHLSMRLFIFGFFYHVRVQGFLPANGSQPMARLKCLCHQMDGCKCLCHQMDGRLPKDIYKRCKNFLPNWALQYLSRGMRILDGLYLRALWTDLNCISAKFPENSFGGPCGAIIFDFDPDNVSPRLHGNQSHSRVKLVTPPFDLIYL